MTEDLKCCEDNCEVPLDQKFWNARWNNEETHWDIGYAAPAITLYMEQYPNKDAAILIPGCGNAYEAQALLQMGFRNITLVDIAPIVVAALKEKFADEPGIKIYLQDFFAHTGQYDLIIEQTFFCAIAPSLRETYSKKAMELLSPKGKVAGLLFDRRFEQGPPFGGCSCEYKPFFESFFHIKLMEPCYNSIKPRKGHEVFFILEKKQSHEL